MTDPLKIIFAGTPEFAAAALAALLNGTHRVVAIYTQPDRPAGRGKQLQPGPVKQLALAHGIEVRQPVSLRDGAAQRALEELAADLMVVAAYGLLLPQAVLDAPRLGCINIHASLLPRWRGAAPIQRAILAGDEETGITIMRMEAGLDTGPMLYKLETPILLDDTGGSLHDRLAELGARALLESLDGIADGSLPARPQDDALATYAPKLAKGEAAIDWTRSALEIERRIRAFNPWPVAQCDFQGQTLRLWRACLSELALPDGAQPGQVLAVGKGGIEVATGAGVLCITELQLPGRRAMPAAAFLNAHAVDGVVLR